MSSVCSTTISGVSAKVDLAAHGDAGACAFVDIGEHLRLVGEELARLYP
jgi:hypothetical protein